MLLILHSKFTIITHELFNITAHVLCINQTKANIHSRIMARVFCFLHPTKSIFTEYSTYLPLQVHKCTHVYICMYLCVLFCL